jgi:hypothetical protein
MKDQGKRLEWKEQRKLLKQIVHIEGRYGNYSILRLSNGRHVILDRSNLKFLLPSSDHFYTLSDDWEQWITRGFIVVIFPTTSDNTEYYIFSVHDKRLITKGKEVRAYAFLQGDSDYFMVKNGDLKEAIFDKNGNQISDWYFRIKPYGLIDGVSDYYIVDENNKQTIFYKDGRQIAEWFDWVFTDGLVSGQSNYYIARKNHKYAIFHKSGKQVSDWFDHIHEKGLVVGESNYYIAERNGEKAIFHKNGQQISDWYDYVDSYGLINNRSDYCIVEKDDKEAIFYKNGYQVTDWFDSIYPVGLIDGKTKYYIGERNKFYYIHKLDSEKSIGPLRNIKDYGFIKDLSENTISLITLDGQFKIFTKQELDNFFEEREDEYDQTK